MTQQIAILGDLRARPLRVRAVRYMGHEWWAIDADDTWPGMVMDLRRLGFESVALEDEVLVREPAFDHEAFMGGSAVPQGLKPFPALHPTIHVRKDGYLSRYADLGKSDDGDDDTEHVEDESEQDNLEDLDV
jgi:hypothetical protein